MNWWVYLQQSSCKFTFLDTSELSKLKIICLFYLFVLLVCWAQTSRVTCVESFLVKWRSFCLMVWDLNFLWIPFKLKSIFNLVFHFKSVKVLVLYLWKSFNFFYSYCPISFMLHSGSVFTFLGYLVQCWM